MPKFNETSPALKKFCLHTRLIKKKWGCGKYCLEGGRSVCEGDCENLVGLPMYDGSMETAEYIWVNIWCMLNWIRHKTAEIHFLYIQLIN